MSFGSATSTEAGVRTESAVVADEAARALDALEQWHQTNRPVHYVRFVRAREQVGLLLGAELEVSGAALANGFAATDEHKQVAVLSALTQLGVPYRYLGSQPGVGFDCSGLTGWAYAEAGVELPRVSRDQIRASLEVTEEAAEAGDLAYYPGHVSIYLGEGLMVHSPNSGNHVEVVQLPTRQQTFGEVEG